MAKQYPRTIATRSGAVHRLDKVHYEMGRGVYRVSWIVGTGADRRARGCLAVVHPDAWQFVEVVVERGVVVDTATPSV